MEIDATTLTPAEWFFIWAAQGTKPNASQRDQHEWFQRSLGMTPAQKHVVFREGLESMMARGFIVPDTDADGRPVFDQQEPPQQVYKCVGRIVSRIAEVPAIIS